MIMIRLKPLLVLLAIAFAIPAFTQTYFAARSPDADAGSVDVIDIGSGSTIISVPVTLNGNPIDGFTGMAIHPTSGSVYAIAKVGSNFHLVTYNATTGSLTSVGILPDKFAGITFHSNGTLYGITGDGADNPEQLYSINTSTASATFIVSPGTGSDGEAIAFNIVDQRIYRYGGGGLLQKIDLATSQVIVVSTSMNVANWAHALYHRPATNDFVFAAGDIIYSMSTTGALTTLSTDATGSGIKGLLPTNVVGVEEPTNVVDLELFPNPASDRVTIVLDSPETKQVLRVFDATGSLVDESYVTGPGQVSYDVQALSEGMYTFELNANGVRHIDQVVIQR